MLYLGLWESMLSEKVFNGVKHRLVGLTLEACVEAADLEGFAWAILKLKDLILDEGPIGCLVEDCTMEVFHANLTDVFVKSRRQIDYVLQLIDRV